MAKHLETGTAGSRLAIIVTTAIITTIVVAGGVALATVGINSVGSAQIKNGSVRSVDIGTGQVKSIDIRNGTVTGVDIRNGTITSKDIRNGDTIRATSASSVEIDESIFSGGAADILTATIRAPRPGLLVMGASVDASGATDDQYTCQIRVDGFIVAGSSRASRVNWQGVDGGTDRTDNSQENCATDAVQVVGAGLHTVAFHVFGRNTAAFHSGTVWAIWVPFDGNGNVPTP